jgi:hypothetical protein
MTSPRRAQEVIEPFVGTAFFIREWREAAARLGLDPMQSYVCSRGAALGRVSGPVVAALFFSFPEERVAHAADSGWALVPPEIVAGERDVALSRHLGELLADEDEAEMSAAAEAIREALAPLPVGGRPMFAAHRRLPRSEDPRLDLWHAANVWREYRGDAHAAASLMAGVAGAEAAVLAALWRGQDPARRLRVINHPPEALGESLASLSERGWVDGADLNQEGRSAREEIEEATDRLTVGPFQTRVDLDPALTVLERCTAAVTAARDAARR